MPDTKKKEKLPPTMDDLDKRLEALEARRDADSLSNEEITRLRSDWKSLKKDEGQPQKATEAGFLDWLFE